MQVLFLISLYFYFLARTDLLHTPPKMLQRYSLDGVFFNFFFFSSLSLFATDIH